MSELVIVFPVIALTAIVLVGLLAKFRKYVLMRDRLMPPPGAEAPQPAEAPRRVPARPRVRVAA